MVLLSNTSMVLTRTRCCLNICKDDITRVGNILPQAVKLFFHKTVLQEIPFKEFSRGVVTILLRSFYSDNTCSYLAHFLSPSSKKKRSTLKKVFYFLIFQKMELPGSNIKRFLIFSYILGNGNPQKNPYVSGNRTFKSRARKKKKNPS